MQAIKVIKPKSVEATRTPLQRNKPVKVMQVNAARRELKIPEVRESRAASCKRCLQRGRCEAKLSRERRSKSGCNAPKTPVNQQHRRATSSSVKPPAVTPKAPQEMSTCRPASQSNKAFTVIPPNSKKRREIQKKAEAELAALEELRLSRAMAYVSINPSSVGGCLSLEEVRLKQQQEMMQAKRKQKPVRKQVMEQTAVLKG
ncbi:uncharacterized protein zgc:194621 [Anoplopoma fimbria]|uniref:uncharacterized protein zgc:194621 n=1 Tax=Anoplopoma fimbria TaxID=229290 RepID=UPI0023EB4C61|nr:uncharacterized protein zgc:194621 [Anoplopoma fimbria]